MADVRTVPEARREIMAAIALDVGALVANVASEVGETPRAVRREVELTLRLLSQAPGATKARSVMRSAGAQAARDGIPAERFLQRFTATTWLVWNATRAHPSADRSLLESMGETLLGGLHLLAGAVADGYNAVDRETVAHDADARRALLEELLSTVPADPVASARRRRLAERYGLEPDANYRLIALSDGRPDYDWPIEDAARALARRLRRPSRNTDPRAMFPLPQVLAWRGLVVVLAHAAWPASTRLPAPTGELLGPQWVAVPSASIQGVEGIGLAMERLARSLRTADRVGRGGWVEGPGVLALEELMTVDDALLDAVVEQELGPILADRRAAPDLIETLEVYVESGHNMRETARRLHLAPRTVAYRLERAAFRLGRPLDGLGWQRLTVALFAHRMGRRPF